MSGEMATRDTVKLLQHQSSEEEGARSDQDGEYVPEQNHHRQSVQNAVNSEVKLKYLMDQIDALTHSLNTQQIFPSQEGIRRHQNPENEDEKDLISQDNSLYTFKLTEQPGNIVGGEMRDYQIEGLNWLLKMNASKINGILADEMGLGKTLQTISLLSQLALWYGKQAPHIVIVPKTTLRNWSKEFNHWSPSLEIFEFYGDHIEREQLRPKVPRIDTYDVCLTTFEVAMSEKNVLKQVRWGYLIIDEAHRIKNEKSVLSQVVRLFHTQNRLLLTGTPLQNNLHELWSLLNFLMPQIFQSSKDFDEWFDLSQANADDRDYLVRQLHRILRPFMLRRLKKDVESRLPPKNELYVFLSMTDMQRELYKGILTKNIWVVNAQGERSQLMNTIMQLRKVCNHPYLFEGVEPGPPYMDGEHLIENCMKFKVLDKLIPRLINYGSKILIFTQMTRMLDILDDYLNFRRFKFCRIDGSTSHIQREMQIEQFQNKDSDIYIFILSTRAGGLGINLHQANTVIIYDSDWNPQVDIQAMDRAHRIGQTKVVTVYRFVTEKTVEEKIAERAARKLKMDHLVIQKGALATQNKAPSIQEMNQIVQFGAQQVLKATSQTVVEEDIEILLEYSQQKTDELNEELAKLEETFNLQDFKMDGSSLYDFEESTQKQIISHTIDLGARHRKPTGSYDIDKYYNNLASKQKNKKKGWRVKVGGGHPHQFFPAQELDELEMKEDKWNDFLQEKQRRRSRNAYNNKPERFTEKDKMLKEQLMQSGFGNWSKRDFNNFIKACELYGRYSYAKIAEEVQTKDQNEIRYYSTVFWENIDQLPNGQEIQSRIEQGESELQRTNHISDILNKKRQRSPSWDDLKIDYSLYPNESDFTYEEDLYIAKALFEQGYGDWDEIRSMIKKESNFRFNLWFLSRTSQEIQERADYLVQIFEMEIGGKAPIKKQKIEEHPYVEITKDYNWIVKLPTNINKA